MTTASQSQYRPIVLDLPLHDYLPGKVYRRQDDPTAQEYTGFGREYRDHRVGSRTWHRRHQENVPYFVHLRVMPSGRLLWPPYPQHMAQVSDNVLSVPLAWYRALVNVRVMRGGRGPPSSDQTCTARREARRLATLLAWHITPALEDAFSLPRTRERCYAPLSFQTIEDLVRRSGWKPRQSLDDFQHRSPFFALNYYFFGPEKPPSSRFAAFCSNLPPLLPSGHEDYLTLVDHTTDCLDALPPDERAAVSDWYAPDESRKTPSLPEDLTPEQDRALQHLRELATEYALRPYSQ